MDTAAQWPQNIMVKVPMEDIANQNQNHQNQHQQNPCSTILLSSPSSSSVERKLVRPHKEQALNCPRCNSTNTKFCYYNNYSLSQPRYFCKTCRRYWTDGGSLRSIPVGGGSRKNKRPSSSSSSSTYHNNNNNNNINNNNNNPSSTSTSSNSSSKKLPDLVPPHQNPKNHFLESQDLNLGFAIHRQHQNHNTNNNNNNNNNHADADFKAITEMIQAPNFENIPSFGGGMTTTTTTSREMGTTLGLQNPNSMELLTAGLSSSSSRGFNNYAFMPLPVVATGGGAEIHHPGAVFGSGFPNLAEYNNSNNNNNNNSNKSSSSLNFSLDYGSYHDNNGDSGSKLLFPFEDLKQDHDHREASNANVNDGDHHHGNGYWNGVIGGGGGGGSW